MSARINSNEGNSRLRISSQCRWWIRNNSTRSITASSSRSRCLSRHSATASSNSSSKLGCSGFGIGSLGGQQQTRDRFDFGVELSLPCLKTLTVEQTDAWVFNRNGNGQVLSVERFDQPILHSRHGNFSSAEIVFELRPHFR